MDKDKYKYKVEIQQMMFVAGEVNDPIPETTALIEDIVRSQVIEILSQAWQLASRRGARSISTEDLMFQIRHDKAKVSRLRTFLDWKDVRKRAKSQQDGGDADMVEEEEDEEELAAGDVAPGKRAAAGTAQTRKKKSLRLSWEIACMFPERVPEQDDDDEDLDDKEENLATMVRLKVADERTRKMTREEYVHWSECRQASFTYRKAKRFREWARTAQIVEGRLNDDIMDILGFLTFEMVAILTEEALLVGAIEHKQCESPDRKPHDHFLFSGPEKQVSAIEPRHVRQAFHRIQDRNSRSHIMRNFSGGLVKSKTQII
ncbi:hypothetical protein CANCADRAFT_2023 [Tortispora caseinolytica NRRL Y-17796]|uniref:Uncharacterized protein n=1 Tax=Tortispora caseinolytica NRRL Y-17796 TaxID=767744 RepID=A0A1E4TEU3_9ASCO|nr:hypothetical protein CANCADRAFT_2023 [Tortispora caseinolytica NRRL Y-17796]